MSLLRADKKKKKIKRAIDLEISALLKNLVINVRNDLFIHMFTMNF